MAPSLIIPAQRWPLSAVLPLGNRLALDSGPAAVLLVVLLSGPAGATAAMTALSSWPIPLALVALMLGIPHGAVDHLMLRSALSRRGWAALTLTYIGVAGSATLAILSAPAVTFVLVLVMTVWHFGSGDVAATAELTSGRVDATNSPVRSRSVRSSSAFRVLHSIAAGAAPVLLPLTSPASAATLRQIRPELTELLAPSVVTGVRAAVLTLVVITFGLLARKGAMRAAGELALLAVLGLLVAPLLGFAVYFALWHALRHTARLAQSSDGVVRTAALGRVFAVGLPALIGTVIVIAVLTARVGSFQEWGSWLWIGLAIVWGLTVPHMVLVSRFDRYRRATAIGL